MKKIMCCSSDSDIVKQYLENWGVNFDQVNDGVFQVWKIEAPAISKRLKDKLIIHSLV
tara:strand:- start:5219 stop:5392 length:174 start_codon:yes stop_codon:yes gene_type:complete